MEATRFEYLPLTSDFKIQIKKEKLQSKMFSDEYQHIVKECWEEEKKLKGDHLYNGWLVHVQELSSQMIQGQLVEYCIYIAQLRSAAFKSHFSIFAAAVDGLLLSNDHILVGKRSQMVTLDQGCWEFVPSGTLSERFIEGEFLDFKKEIQKEFQEETAFNPKEIERMQVLGAMQDHLYKTIEIIVLLEASPDLYKKSPSVSSEYDAFEWVPKTEIEAFFLRKNPNEISRFSLALMKQWFSMPPL